MTQSHRTNIGYHICPSLAGQARTTICLHASVSAVYGPTGRPAAAVSTDPNAPEHTSSFLRLRSSPSTFPPSSRSLRPPRPSAPSRRAQRRLPAQWVGAPRGALAKAHQRRTVSAGFPPPPPPPSGRGRRGQGGAGLCPHTPRGAGLYQHVPRGAYCIVSPCWSGRRGARPLRYTAEPRRRCDVTRRSAGVTSPGVPPPMWPV